MWMAAAAGGFVAAVASHAAWRRRGVGGTAVSSFATSGLIWGAATGAATYVVVGPSTAAVALLAYALVCEVYIFLFTFVTHSVSALVLAALKDGPRGVQELEQLCNPEGMVLKRRKRMLETGLLEPSLPDARVTDRGRRLILVFDRLNGFFFPHPRTR